MVEDNKVYQETRNVKLAGSRRYLIMTIEYTQYYLIIIG